VISVVVGHARRVKQIGDTKSTVIIRPKYERAGIRYANDLTDAERALIGAVDAAAQSGGRGRASLNLPLRSGSQNVSSRGRGS
jgi:hypothetical protein